MKRSLGTLDDVLRSWLNRIVSLIGYIANFGSRKSCENHAKVLIVTDVSDIDRQTELAKALNFYCAGISESSVSFSPRFRLLKALRAEFVLFDQPRSDFQKRVLRGYSTSYVVDKWNPFAAWEWVKFASDFQRHSPKISTAKKNFSRYVDSLLGHGFEKSYIFGTGPSLAKAHASKFRDGYKIVCNTVVRNEKFFEEFEPHFVVAGDALYHFSFVKLAREFRKDLRARMAESSFLFVYPATFDVIVQREFPEFFERLVPIPMGTHTNICVNLAIQFELPSVGNVLPLLQIPVAASLSRDIYMWGYDGKSPSDQENAFWENSRDHSYPDLMSSLVDHFPGFFHHYVPNHDSTKYIEDSQGLEFENRLLQAESNGFSFTMLHPSWTATLAKRFRGSP